MIKPYVLFIIIGTFNICSQAHDKKLNAERYLAVPHGTTEQLYAQQEREQQTQLLKHLHQLEQKKFAPENVKLRIKNIPQRNTKSTKSTLENTTKEQQTSNNSLLPVIPAQYLLRKATQTNTKRSAVSLPKLTTIIGQPVKTATQEDTQHKSTLQLTIPEQS